MSDPRFPNRPDHPDLWLISQGLIEQDAQADQGQDFPDMVSRYVDLASVTYVAMQRAGRGVTELSKSPVISAKRVEAAVAAAWVDAFVQGIRFQTLKREQESDAMYPYVVGQVGGPRVGPGVPPLARFQLKSDAEAYIGIIEQRDPTGVYNGDYYIDGPSED